MFSEDRSDFAVPVAGFILIGFFALLYAIVGLNSEFNFTTDIGMGTIPTLIAILEIILGAIALKKAYLTEGFSFIAFGLFVLSINNGMSFPLGIGFLLFFAVFAYMSYRAFILDLAIINGLMALSSILVFMTELSPAIVGVVMIVIAAIAVYVAICDWMFIQDLSEEYAEAMYGCDCGCDDDDCCCGDDCCCEEED